jgi:hypothetical protein
VSASGETLFYISNGALNCAPMQIFSDFLSCILKDAHTHFYAVEVLIMMHFSFASQGDRPGTRLLLGSPVNRLFVIDPRLALSVLGSPTIAFHVELLNYFFYLNH